MDECLMAICLNLQSLDREILQMKIKIFEWNILRDTYARGVYLIDWTGLQILEVEFDSRGNKNKQQPIWHIIKNN